MIRIGYYVCPLLLIVLLSSCSATKCLPEGDNLYTGSTVNIKDPQNSPMRIRKVLQDDLDGAVLPRPNSRFLGIRLKLGIFSLSGCDTSVGRGIRGLLRRFAEPPVLASQFDSVKNRNLLVNIMENRGFFYPDVKISLKTRGRKTRSVFDITTGPMYTIRNVEFVVDGSQLSADIAAQREKTLLKQDAPFNLDLIKGERERIDNQLKEIGYYYFVPDYLIIEVDSTVGNYKVDMYVRAKDDVPAEAREVYHINRVFIYPNHRLATRDARGVDTTITPENDTLFYERYYIIGNTKRYKPALFTQAMQFYPGDPYNKTDQNMALNRLVNMGTFKFVRNEFEPQEDNLLDVYYYLTPYPKKAIRTELGAYTKSDSRVGSLFNMSWRNRNTFRGAELLAIKASIGTEVQRGGGGNYPTGNTYQFGFEPSLTVPRFLIPFFDPMPSSVYVPQTTLRIGYDGIMRERLYVLHSFRITYGYIWKENIRSEHQLFPFNATYVFADTLNEDTTIFINYNNLIFNGLIIGPTYDYQFNTRVMGQPHLHDFFFNGNVDLSGNILGLIQGSSLNEAPKTIFGAEYAQYARIMADFRHYMNYDASPHAIWANRIIVGIGYPYGNSYQLPNIKQFFSGGNSSLRGFRSRLVGPGGFHEPTNHQTLFETSGDIKLELNTEIRRQLYSFIHGAVFADAGNIWTVRPNPIYDNLGEFSGRFLSELAMNVGVGLRLDFKLLVLRLDLGIPVRKPWLTERSPWQLNLNFGDPEWRGDNMILNLAIGYPF